MKLLIILGFIVGWMIQRFVMAPGGNLGGDMPNYPEYIKGVMAVGSGGFWDAQGLAIRNYSLLKGNDTVLSRSATGFGNNSGASTATLTNAPVSGNPTKWVTIDDNGTTRSIPAW